MRKRDLPKLYVLVSEKRAKKRGAPPVREYRGFRRHTDACNAAEETVSLDTIVGVITYVPLVATGQPSRPRRGRKLAGA